MKHYIPVTYVSIHNRTRYNYESSFTSLTSFTSSIINRTHVFTRWWNYEIVFLFPP